MSRWHDIYLFFFFFVGWMNWTNHWNDFSGPCTEKTGGTDHKRPVYSICSRSSLDGEAEGSNIEENSTVRRNFVNCTLPVRVGKQENCVECKIQVGKTVKKNEKTKKNRTGTYLHIFNKVENWRPSCIIPLINHSVVILLFSTQVDDPKDISL